MIFIFNWIPQAFIQIKNFEFGLEWIWSKEKFLDRKADMSEFYLDLKDGAVESKKFLV